MLERVLRRDPDTEVEDHGPVDWQYHSGVLRRSGDARRDRLDQAGQAPFGVRADPGAGAEIVAPWWGGRMTVAREYDVWESVLLREAGTPDPEPDALPG